MLKNTITQQNKQWLMLAGLFSVAFLSTKTLANALPQVVDTMEDEEETSLKNNRFTRLRNFVQTINPFLRVQGAVGTTAKGTFGARSASAIFGGKIQLPNKKYSLELGIGPKLENSALNMILTASIGYLILETFKVHGGLNLQFHDILQQLNISPRPYFGFSNSFLLNEYLTLIIHGGIEICAKSSLFQNNSAAFSKEKRDQLAVRVRAALKGNLENLMTEVSSLESIEAVKKYTEALKKKCDEMTAKVSRDLAQVYKLNLRPYSGDELTEQYFNRALAKTVLNGTKQIIGEINNTMEQITKDYDPAKSIEALENIWATVIQLYENIETDSYIANISMMAQSKRPSTINSLENLLKHIEFHIGITLEMNNNYQDAIDEEELTEDF